MDEKDKIFSVEVNGQKFIYEIIKVIIPTTGKYKYVVYTDNGDNVYASRFKLENNKVVLEDIVYQYEFDYIERVMEGRE